MQIHAISAFSDNYIWVLAADGHALVVDPGDAAPVLAFLQAQQLTLDAVLITHHHPDHVGGLPALLNTHPAPVYGPRAEAARIATLTHLLDDGDQLDLLGQRFDVIAIPGHTLGHIAYFAAGTPGLLFCGDTLFSAGCGRLFEGSAEDMYASLSTLAALPDSTQVYCAHEYTLSNLAFAAAVEPDNADIRAHITQVQQWRRDDRPSLPSTLAQERRINPFLRTHVAAVQATASRWHGQALTAPSDVLGALRRWKDGFKAT